VKPTSEAQKPMALRDEGMVVPRLFVPAISQPSYLARTVTVAGLPEMLAANAGTKLTVILS
jgi:hypothetical protein